MEAKTTTTAAAAPASSAATAAAAAKPAQAAATAAAGKDRKSLHGVDVHGSALDRQLLMSRTSARCKL